MSSTDYNQIQLVAFRLGDEEYAVPVQNVESIIKLSRPTRVPGVPYHVRGVMNLRGKVMSIFDLRRRFGMGCAADETDMRVLVVAHDGMNTGMLVDGVSEVLTIDGDALQAPPAELGGQGRAVAGLCRVEDRLVIVLDLGSVFDVAETMDQPIAEQVPVEPVAAVPAALAAAEVEEVEADAPADAPAEEAAPVPTPAG
jgi:purine-binding chemotaxis protein CheW